MNISRGDAAGALRDVEAVQARSAERRGYRTAAPFLMLWGAVWAAGYALMANIAQSDWGWIWLLLDLIGVAASVRLGTRDLGTRPPLGSHSRTWRALAGGVFVALFVVATYAVFAPQSVAPAIVYPGLVAGLIYGAIGTMYMPRLAVIGLSIFLLTLIGFFFAQAFLLYWMAVVGGGGLFVSGLWLRNSG